MPVPSSISDLSTTPSLNSPAGTESPSTVDDYLRTQAAFIKQVDDKATGTVKATDLAAPGGSALVGFDWAKLPSAINKIDWGVQTASGGVNLLRYIPPAEWPAIFNYTSTYDATADINAALAAHDCIQFPQGLVRSWGGHVITNKELYGFSRESSIIKALGVNQPVTLFVNDRTDHTAPGTWGSGKNFRLERLGIRGNWDKVTGLTSVTENGATMNVGVLKADYSPAQSALIKGVSAAYCDIINCYIDDAWEHGVLFYRLGYAEISGNIIARCRGSGIWLTADSAAAAVTSTIVERNQVVANRGGYGGLRTLYTYGCAIRDNRPLEDNTWGATFGEGADTDISGNYFEINPFGDASIDPTLWGLTLLNNYWTIPPTLPSGGAARGFFSYDRKWGLRHLCPAGLGETDNRLGPVRYSSDADTIGIGRGTPAASSGTGLTFPATQNASTDPNTLDDYEEGSFTPTGNGVTFSAATGHYIKIGRVVNAWFSVTMPATANGSAFQIGGLPFNATAPSGVAYSAHGYAPGMLGGVGAGNAFIGNANMAGSAFITNADVSAQVVSGSVVYMASS